MFLRIYNLSANKIMSAREKDEYGGKESGSGSRSESGDDHYLRGRNFFLII